jgi:hypothetical protein
MFIVNAKRMKENLIFKRSIFDMCMLAKKMISKLIKQMVDGNTMKAPLSVINLILKYSASPGGSLPTKPKFL